MNRYTQLTPAQFSPLSLQEMMMVPLAKQKQYDSALAEISENKLFNNQYLDVHSDIVNKEIDAMTGDLKGIEDELMSSGDVGSIKKRLVDLATRRKNFLSPQGIGGQAQAVRDQYLKNIEAINKDRTMRPEDKEWYKRNALNQYVQSQKALTDESIASYSDYSGYASRDVINEAIKIASGITIDNDTFVNDSGTVENKKQRSKEFIYKNIMNQLGSDTNLINYLKETGYGNNYMQVLQNAAINAANQKVVDESHLRGTGKNSTSGSQSPNLRMSSTGITGRVAETALGKQVSNAVSSIDAYNSNVARLKSKLENSISPTERQQIKNDLSIISDIYKVAEQRVRKELEIPNDFSERDVIANVDQNKYSFELSKGIINEYLNSIPPEKLESSEIMNTNVYEVTDNQNGTITISNKAKNRASKKQIELGIDINDGSASLTLNKEELVRFKKFQQKINEKLENDSIIPFNNFILSANPYEKGSVGKNILNAVENEALKTIKFNLNNEIKQKLALNDEELYEHFKKSSGNHKLFGISQSKVTGDIFINIEVDTDKADNLKKGDNILQIPITRIGKDGKIPHAFQTLLNDFKSSLNQTGKVAFEEMESEFKLKNIIVDTYSDVSVNSNKIFDKTDSQLIKNQIIGQDTPLTKELNKYDNFKLISQKEIDYKGNKIQIPYTYKSLIYSKGQDKAQYLNVGEYMGSMMNVTKRNKRQALDFILQKANVGILYFDENLQKQIKSVFEKENNEESINKLIDLIKDYPLMSSNKRDLLVFK